MIKISQKISECTTIIILPSAFLPSAAPIVFRWVVASVRTHVSTLKIGSTDMATRLISEIMGVLSWNSSFEVFRIRGLWIKFKLIIYLSTSSFLVNFTAEQMTWCSCRRPSCLESQIKWMVQMHDWIIKLWIFWC